MKALAVVVAALFLTPVFHAQAYEALDDQALIECFDSGKLEMLKARQKYVDEQIKPELSALFDELQAMRGTQIFHELGFSPKNLTTADWRARVEHWRDRLHSIPVVRAGWYWYYHLARFFNSIHRTSGRRLP